MRITTNKFLKLSIALLVGFFFFLNLPKPASAQCDGFTLCGAWDPQKNFCDPDRGYTTGCGNGCNPGGCGDCEISNSCSGGTPVVCECGTRADGTCKPCSGGGQCNSDYIVNCASGTKTQELTNTACVRIRGACKEGDGRTIKVGTAQSLGGCCEEWDPDGDGNLDCRSQNVYTYTCCPTGTEADCRPEGTNYERINDCRQPTRCTNVGDTYISHRGAPETKANRCYKSCNESGCEWVYNVITTCRSNRIVCDCVPVCTATAPTNLNFRGGNLIWNAGTGGTSQYVYVSKTQSDITNNCGVRTNCVVNANVSSNTRKYVFSPALDAGTVYYAKVINYKDASCSASSTIYSFLTPLPNNPWWQVKDGDVSTNGSLGSDVPDGYVFADTGIGGYPGVPLYNGRFNLTSTSTKISATRWNVNTENFQPRAFNYTFFNNLIPEDMVFNDISTIATGGTADENGYEWYKVSADLSVGGIDFGTRKVIVFIDGGNLNLEGSINVTDGQGFVGFFVEGNITVDPLVANAVGPEIEGIYLSNGSFSTGAGDSQLHLRGSVVSNGGGILLQRELTDNTTTPAEIFEFAPDQLVLFPNSLRFKQTKWVEVNP